jgi:hypothetical protein
MFINVSFNFTIIHQNLPQLNSKLIAPNVWHVMTTIPY